MQILFYLVCNLADPSLDFQLNIRPGKPRSFTYKVPLNKDGVPVLPYVAGDASAPQVSVLLGDYLETLWGTHLIEILIELFSPEYSWAGKPRAPPFPWGDIATNPDRYFDTSLFNLP